MRGSGASAALQAMPGRSNWSRGNWRSVADVPSVDGKAERKIGQFEFVPIPMGSGWISGHVAIDEYYTFSDREGEKEMCLNLDTQDFGEFSTEIDRLIAELEAVRETARRKFQKAKAAKS